MPTERMRKQPPPPAVDEQGDPIPAADIDRGRHASKTDTAGASTLPRVSPRGAKSNAVGAPAATERTGTAKEHTTANAPHREMADQPARPRAEHQLPPVQPRRAPAVHNPQEQEPQGTPRPAAAAQPRTTTPDAVPFRTREVASQERPAPTTDSAPVVPEGNPTPTSPARESEVASPPPEQAAEQRPAAVDRSSSGRGDGLRHPIRPLSRDDLEAVLQVRAQEASDALRSARDANDPEQIARAKRELGTRNVALGRVQEELGDQPLGNVEPTVNTPHRVAADALAGRTPLFRGDNTGRQDWNDGLGAAGYDRYDLRTQKDGTTVLELWPTDAHPARSPQSSFLVLCLYDNTLPPGSPPVTKQAVPTVREQAGLAEVPDRPSLATKITKQATLKGPPAAVGFAAGAAGAAVGLPSAVGTAARMGTSKLSRHWVAAPDLDNSPRVTKFDLDLRDPSVRERFRASVEEPEFADLAREIPPERLRQIRQAELDEMHARGALSDVQHNARTQRLATVCSGAYVKGGHSELTLLALSDGTAQWLAAAGYTVERHR